MMNSRRRTTSSLAPTQLATTNSGSRWLHKDPSPPSVSQPALGYSSLLSRSVPVLTDGQCYIFSNRRLSPQYGYHISALNQIQAVLTCKTTADDNSPLGLPNCIPMTDAQFSALTSVFSVGGLIGSAGANVVMDTRGRRGALRISAILTALGAFSMTFASGYALLLIGRCVLSGLHCHITQPTQLPRLLIGIAAGIGVCLTPIFIAEVSPARIRGKVGQYVIKLRHLPFFTLPHRRFHPILHRDWDNDHTTHRVQACDSNCLALCPPFVRPGCYCTVPRQPHHDRVPGVDCPQW